jgi:hypothetical protein
MNSADRFEFEVIRRDQARVRELVGHLDRRIDVLTRRHEEPEEVVPVVRLPPPLPLQPESGNAVPSSPEELPPRVQPASNRPAAVEATKPTAPLPEKGQGAGEAPSDRPGESLELRVGTYWMSRVGMVILLTGLVFLGNYAYHRIVPLLGAWGKLALLVLAGGALAGLGAYLEKSREAMRNYGRVLLAGGAAALYYTAYAAHFVDALRVIESPVIGGGLLLSLTGGFMWHADRRRSEAVAVPAVLLAYYTSAINPIGSFTLFSNLLLTAAAIFFLARHRWTKLTFASLAATYGSYAFWHLQHLAQSGGAPGEYGLGLTFLGCYWALFTAAVFIAAPETMNGPTRVTFLSLNNGAFFCYAALHFQQYRPASFWIFAVAFGAVLLGLAMLAARFRSKERALDGAYLAQGIGLVTLGLAAKLTGPQLAVILGVESATLLSLSRRRHGWLYEVAGGLCAVGAFAVTLVQMDGGAVSPLALGLPVAALLGFDAWWVKRLRDELECFSERACAFALLGLILIAAVIGRIAPGPWMSSIYAAAAAVSLLALRGRLPEIALPGQGFFALGLFVFFSRSLGAGPEPWWSALPLLVVTLGLMHWWQRQQSVSLPKEFRELLEWTYAGVAMAVGVFWMNRCLDGEAWMVGTSLAALATLLYGCATRAWMLALAGQVFTLLSLVAFARELIFGHPAWLAALAPMANTALVALLPFRRFKGAADSLPEGVTFKQIAGAYRLATFALLGCWGFEYVSPIWRVTFFATMGAGQMVFGATTGDRERARVGAVYAGAALVLFWARLGTGVIWGDLLGILIIPASLRLARRLANGLPLPIEVRNALVGAAVASLWLWVTRWTVWHGYGDQLTATWAALALLVFLAGLGLRERIYRLGGFGGRGGARRRRVFMDVWRFDALARIVSFLVLGAVLLSLSFIYHRLAETFRRWV